MLSRTIKKRIPRKLAGLFANLAAHFCQEVAVNSFDLFLADLHAKLARSLRNRRARGWRFRRLISSGLEIADVRRLRTA
jgi:hypothetical protein